MVSITSRHDPLLTTARQGEQGCKYGRVTGLRRLGVTQRTASRTTRLGLHGGPPMRGPVAVGDAPQQPGFQPRADLTESQSAR